ncbi:MAG: AmpG family muropeptide MFS transporter [Rhodanobacteraceae bacterium]
MPTEPVAAAPVVVARGRNWRILSIGLLGFSSGLPLALSNPTLQAWFTTAGLSLRDIGFITLTGTAYVLKPLWSPLLDRFQLPWLGRRRGWILLMQAICGLALIAMSFNTPQGAAVALVFLAVLVAFSSATQDIAYDAHRTDLLRPAERGWGIAFMQGGYRIAMVVSGALALILAEHAGWTYTYRLMGVLMLAMMVVTVRSPDAPDESPVRSFTEAVVGPFADFFQRYRGLAFAWLALMVLYMISDAFALGLWTTFLLRVPGFTLTQVGAVNKIFSLVAGLVGALAGGWVVTKLRLFPALLVLGICQALANLSFVLLVHSGPDVRLLASVVSAEWFFAGLAGTAFVVLLTALCNVRFSATQYALLSALTAVGRIVAGPLSAWLIPHVGWSNFFVLAALSAIPGLLLVIGLRKAIHQAELDRPH